METAYLRGGEERKPQKTSNVTRRPFPFGSLRVPIILVPGDSEGSGNTIAPVIIANSVPDKILLLKNLYRPDNGDVLLAPWPGQNVQDVFVIDEVDVALDALERTLR